MRGGPRNPQRNTWAFEGAAFPNGDAPSDVTDVIVNGGVRPYPDGLLVRDFPVAAGRHVAIIYIPPSSTPPCITKGTVYERVAGKTIPVTDPSRLAALFERCDGARRAGVAKAERIATDTMDAAGSTRDRVRFALGLAAPGLPLDVTPRLFGWNFNARAQQRIRDVLNQHLPTPLEGDLIVEVTQFKLIYAVRATDPLLGHEWLIHVAREGAIGIHWTIGAERTSVASMVKGIDSPFGKAWQYAHQTLNDLGLAGPHYLQAQIGAALAPTWLSPIGRGDVRGPTEDSLAGIERELRRAAGEMIFETQA